MTHTHFKVSMILNRKKKKMATFYFGDWAAFGLLLTVKICNTATLL